MRHRVGGKQLNRTKNQRRALFRSLANSLILHEKIVTTSAKAKAVKPMVEKLVTRSKVDSVHNRRQIMKELVQENTTRKMFEVVGPKFKERPGGYTKIVKVGSRAGDKAPMVALMFVEEVGLAKVQEIKVVEKKDKKIEKKVVNKKETKKKTEVKKIKKDTK